MGVDTKGVVVTPCKDVLLICSLVQHSLDALIDDERRLVFPGNVAAWAPAVREQFSSIDIHLRPDVGLARFSFRFLGVTRTLTVFFTCDVDNKALAERTISLSMGCSGHSEVFVKTALHALSLLGPVYFDLNDCDEIPLAPLDEAYPTLMQALHLRYVRAPAVEDWVAYFKDTRPGRANNKASRQAFFGIDDTTLQKALDLGPARWLRFKSLADASQPPTVRFLRDYHELRAREEEASALA